jgi:hypothetical protein
MFNLTIVDHIRLSFGHVVQNYTRHAQAADRLTTIALYARIAMLALLGVALGLGAAVVLGAGRRVQISLVVTLAIAFGGYALAAALAIEERLLGHRYRANRLWLLCERYRALLAEVHDGLLDRETVLVRRDALIQQFSEIDEQASSVQSSGPRLRSRTTTRELTEDQIDEFLPVSLRKSPDTEPQAHTSH